MQRGRKIVALTIAILLVLSAMSCFTFAAPTYSQLPEGYLVVNTNWTGYAMQETFDYELGGELYQLEYGITAFSSVEAASAAWMPEGIERTIVLAPGIYSTAMTLTSDVNLCGPYFGKNPNNNPKSDDYDPSLPDWALKNDRSIDPTKEAVFSADIIIGTGCNNLIIDGIAFTGKGRIKDTTRTAERVLVNYTFKNLYFLDGSVDSYFLMNSDKINRYVTIDSIRAENNSSVSRFHNTKAESVTFKNSLVKDICAGADKNTTSVLEYLGGITPSECLSLDKHLARRYHNNHFENIGGINVLNFAARESGVAGISQRDRVTLELIGNEFINVGANGGRTIQDQISYHNQEFICVDNYFQADQAGYQLFGTYYDNVGGTPSFSNMKISGNVIRGYDTLMSSSSSYPYYIDSTNKAYTSAGADKALTSGSVIQESSSSNLITAWKDAEVLRYNTARRLYIYPSDEDIANGYYAFDAAAYGTLADGATIKFYADDSRAVELNRIILSKDENKNYAFARATKGSITEDYEVVIYAVAPKVNVNTGGSSDCKLHLFDVIDAERVVDTGDGYVVFMKDGVTSIKPSINVDKAATYSFFMDEECKYETADTSAVNLEAKVTTFYIRVTAQDGTKSEAIPVTIISDRKIVSYADAASVPSYARKAVNFLNSEGYGVFVGDQNKKINSRANITRYELAKVIVTLSGVNVKMAESVKLHEIYDDFFAMQTEAPWALPYIRAATAAGLIQGVSDKNNLYFAGSSTTTREQFTAVFMRSVAVAQSTTVDAMYNANAAAIEKAFKNKYKDASNISSWAKKAVKVANYYSIINGDGKNFNPSGKIIRADVAVIAYNYINTK